MDMSLCCHARVSSSLTQSYTIGKGMFHIQSYATYLSFNRSSQCLKSVFLNKTYAVSEICWLDLI